MNSFSEEIVDEIPKDKTESTAYVSPIDVETLLTIIVVTINSLL